ncbi:MAG: NAD-dependent epimerase/dehydratase family protein [Oscillospiraceae bacterium]|nr:NAD-dependent epimerase/dehydratase family protein [Oscillospiraceae bacterium]
MKILITGANGFIGNTLRVHLSLKTDAELLLFDLPQTLADLNELACGADFVFHLAGVNRPEKPEEFWIGNAGLTGDLVKMLERQQRGIPLVLSSSVQAELDNPYGRSKREAERLVFEYSKKTGAPVYAYRLPNVFGKWCRPNYNSVVATFCHNAATKRPLRIDDPAKELTLLYIDDIIREFLRIVDGGAQPCAESCLSITPVYSVTVGDLASKITAFAESRRSFTLGYNMGDPLTKKLYATFLAYTEADDLSNAADMKTDYRGFFAELIRSPYFGQISISRTKPGIKRGDHWHSTKAEKFIVIEGKAVIQFRKIGSKDKIVYCVSGDKLEVVDMPTGYTHSIQNVGETDVLTIFWAGEIFDPENPDTIIETV